MVTTILGVKKAMEARFDTRGRRVPVTLIKVEPNAVGANSIFTPGDEVKVTGWTKGKGFTGVVKRWGFAGGPKTHGQSDRHRAPGSIGQTTTPGRVYRGKRMAGHMGNVRHTVTGLEVIETNPAKNLLVVKGSVPGAANGYLTIEKTGQVKTYTPPPEEKPEEEKSPETKGPAGEKETEGPNETREKKEEKEVVNNAN